MDWPISWDKVKSQLSVAPPLYLKEPVNITWDGTVTEENRFDDSVRIYDGAVDLKDLDGGTMSCKSKDGTIYTGTCYVISGENTSLPSNKTIPFFVVSDGGEIAAVMCQYSGEAEPINVGVIVTKESIGIPLPIGIYTPVVTTDTLWQLMSIKGTTKNLVQISDPYKDFFAAMPHGVYNITVNNLVATPEGTEITDADLIAQLNKLPKQAGFLMNLTYGATNGTVSAYPGVSITGDEYACFINIGSNTLMFGNKNGTWKFHLLGSE